MDSNSRDRELNKILNDEPVEFGWWLEICTAQPIATYYFGSFDSQLEAELAKAGYIEDLKQEEAEVVTVRIKQCRPRQLTICEDELSFGRRGASSDWRRLATEEIRDFDRLKQCH